MGAGDKTADSPKSTPPVLQVEPWATDMVLIFEAQAHQTEPRFFRPTDLRQLPAGQQILALGLKELMQIVAAIATRLKEIKSERFLTTDALVYDVEFYRRWDTLRELARHILRRHLPWSQEELAAVITYGIGNDVTRLPYVSLLQQVEHAVEARVIEDSLADALRRLAIFANLRYSISSDPRKFNERLQRLISGTAKPDPALVPGEWRSSIFTDLESLPAAAAAVSRRALDHAVASMERAKASNAFLQSARSILAEDERLPARVMGWVEAYASELDRPGENEDAVRALIWMLGVSDGAKVASRIGRFSELCFKKRPNFGPRSLKLGNACLQSLKMLGGVHAAAELTRLRSRLRYPRVVGQVETILADFAARLGLDREELEEMALPTFELSGEGERRLPVGESVAIIRIVGTREVRLSWQHSDGREVAAVPKALKETSPDSVRAARAFAKDIEGALAGQSARIERLYFFDRRIAFDSWRERYLEHPLVAALTGRLIWSFESSDEVVAGLPREGRIEGARGEGIKTSADMSVSLWHPLRAEADDVLAWRRRLARLSVTQPFKQAHREIYVLTDAERQTEFYSNRFAAHILRQHQFKALCDQRGWRFHLMGQWDSHNTPTRSLPWRNTHVEYWVDMIEDAETTGAAVYTLISTDQVRFVAGDGTPLRLADVPPLLFSETMRDVDLFVGVASVGNDPNWIEGGRQARFNPYWQDYAFGELGASGRTRADVLSTLLPSLDIAAQCELDGRFLVVRGKLRTYKIHLGSGNIQMAPNDQYLCIVPGRGPPGMAAVDNLVLPFEGDRTLSIILSKAFLLAADDKIKDASIFSQITRR
jgi:hypothetical protein